MSLTLTGLKFVARALVAVIGGLVVQAIVITSSYEPYQAGQVDGYYGFIVAPLAVLALFGLDLLLWLVGRSSRWEAFACSVVFAVALIVAVSALVNRDWEVAHRLELTLLTSGFAVPCAIIWYLLHLGGIARSVRSMNTDG